MADVSNPPEQIGGLIRAHVSDQRLSPYMAATFNDEAKAFELYLWDRQLATAFFHDLSVLEVALRNTIDRALTNRYGPEWIRLSSVLFDRRTYEQIAEAWERLPSKFHNVARGDGKIRGRLIASCMFGVWNSVLDVGGKTAAGDGPCASANHDDVWTRDLVVRAFPGAGKIARAERAQLDRSWVHGRVREVHILRNRVAHNESLINGYPVPGTGGGSAEPVRRSARDGAVACVELAQMMDSELAEFVAKNSDVERLLESDPRKEWGFV